MNQIFVVEIHRQFRDDTVVSNITIPSYYILPLIMPVLMKCTASGGVLLTVVVISSQTDVETEIFSVKSE